MSCPENNTGSASEEKDISPSDDKMNKSDSDDKKTHKNGSSNENKERRDSGSDIASQVRSANDWEHADLGDDNRREKFLKLMGASKAEHKGKIVIGDHSMKHKGDDPGELNKKLETQFQHGLEHKLKGGYKHHTGLGFSDETKPAEVEEKGETDVKATPDSDVVEERLRVNEETEKEAAVTESAEKRKADSPVEDGPSPKKKPMMSFVKASSDS